MVNNAITAAVIAGVTNTLNGAMIAMDCGDDDKFSSFFVPKGHLIIKVSNVTKVGREQIGPIASGVKAKFPTAQHWEGNVYLSKPLLDELELGHVKDAVKNLLDEHKHLTQVHLVANKSYWKAVDGGDIIAQGEHHDILVQMEPEGPWLLVIREIHHTWTKSGGFLTNQAQK